MKRSEINEAIQAMEALTKEYRFALPPFASSLPQEGVEKGEECDEIRYVMLG